MKRVSLFYSSERLQYVVPARNLFVKTHSFVAAKRVACQSKEKKKMSHSIKTAWIGLLLFGMLTALSGTAQTPASIPTQDERTALQKELKDLESRLDSLRYRG